MMAIIEGRTKKTLAYGLPVLSLRRTWDVLDVNEPTGRTGGAFRGRMI
jgi:hypothetical protein